MAQYKTLEDLNGALRAAGCNWSKAVRSYKRKDHREVVIFANLPCDPATKQADRKVAAKAVLKALSEQFPTEFADWSYCKGAAHTRIEFSALIQQADGF